MSQDKIMTVSEYCRKYHVQSCHVCERLECCDNMTENNRVFTKLVNDMENWGGWEDGIPDEFYDNWIRARELLGLPKPPKEATNDPTSTK